MTHPASQRKPHLRCLRPLLLALLLTASLLPLVAAQPLAAAFVGSRIAVLSPLNDLTQALRHCDYICSATSQSIGSNTPDDFHFDVLLPNNGAAAASSNASSQFAVSLRSVDYPTYYLSVLTGGTVGIVTNPDPSNSSWLVTSGVAPGSAGNASLLSLQSLSTSSLGGGYLTQSNTNQAPCGYTAPSADVIVAPLSSGLPNAPLRQTWLMQLYIVTPVVLNVSTNTSSALPVSRRWFGCHADEGYVRLQQAWSSNLIYGSSFEAGTLAVPGWNTTGGLGGGGLGATAGLDSTSLFNSHPGMTVSLSAAAAATPGSESFVANRGIGGSGFALQGGQPYWVTVYAKSPSAGVATAFVELRDRLSGNLLLAHANWTITNSSWAAYNFTLTPSAGTVGGCGYIAAGSDATIDCGVTSTPAHVCLRCGGELRLGVVSPAAYAPSGPLSVSFGFVDLSPGPWGLLNASDGTPLPVLKSGSDMLRAMGTTLIRFGGTVSQVIRWKDWRRPVPFRPSQQLVWDKALLSGFGPFELIDMATAMGIEPIVTLAYDLNNATDFGDLVEYCWGQANTTWGALRIADGHPAPFNITVFELGNEQANPNYVAQVLAMEARSATVGSPPLKYMYPLNSGVPASQQAQFLSTPGFAPASTARLLADLHVGAGGAVAEAESLFTTFEPGFVGGAVNAETNAVTMDMGRAIAEAADLIAWLTSPPASMSRMYMRTASFCTETSPQWDGQWDQGLAFFNAAQWWLQPPGWVHAMLATAGQPAWTLQPVVVSPVGGAIAATLAVSVHLTSNSSTLVVFAVNSGGEPQPLNVSLGGGGTPLLAGGSLRVWTMVAPAGVTMNTPQTPNAISPMLVVSPLSPGMQQMGVVLPPNSVLVASAPLDTTALSPSASPTATPTSTATLSLGAAPSVTSSPSLSASPSPTTSSTPSYTPTISASPFLRIATALLVDLHAADFPGLSSDGLVAWDNRASTAAAINLASGDFVASGPAGSAPTAATVRGAPAVVFNVTSSSGSVPQYLAANAALPLFSGMYGTSDWSYEAWVLQTGYMTGADGAESPLFQWSPRPAASTCGSSFSSVGSDPAWGAGGHWNCDIAWSASASTVTYPGHGYGLTVGVWHYVAWTYGGSTNGTETLYLDGVVNTVITGRALNVANNGQMYVGSWLTTTTWMGGDVAIGALRMHDGVLSPGDVASNFAYEQPVYASPNPSPSSTPTATASGSLTPTASLTPSASATLVTATPSASQASITATQTASLTPLWFASSGLAIGSRISFLSPLSNTSLGLRHCNYVASATLPTVGASTPEDFNFDVIAANDGLPAGASSGRYAVSFRSVDYPAYYLSVLTGGAVGIVTNPDPSNSSWLVTSGLAPGTAGNASAVSLQSLSTSSLGGGYLTLSNTNKAPCGYALPSGDIVVAPLGGIPGLPNPAQRATWLVTVFASTSPSGTRIPSPTNSVLSTGTATVSGSATVPPTPSTSDTATASSSHTATASASHTGTASASRTDTPSSSHTGTASASRTDTPSSSHTGTASSSHTGTASVPATATSSGSQSRSATDTSSPSSTDTPTATASGTRTGSITGSITAAATTTGTISASLSSTRSGTATRTPSSTLSTTGTPTPTSDATSTRTATGSGAPTSSPSAVATGSTSPTSAATGSGSDTGSASPTSSVSGTESRSGTRTSTHSGSQTRTSTTSSSGTQTSSSSASPSSSTSSSGSHSQSATRSRSLSHTSKPSVSTSTSPPATVSSSASTTGAPTASTSGSNTPPPTASLSASLTATVSLTPLSQSHAATHSPTSSRTTSVLASPSKTVTRTSSGTRTETGTTSGTRTQTRTPSSTRTASRPASVSRKGKL